MQRMEEFTLTRRVDVKNELRERESTWIEVGTIRAAVSVATGSTQEQNQALRVTSTHRGLTPDDVCVGDRFGGYVVDYVIPGRVYRELLLTREDAVQEGATSGSD